MNVNTVPAIDRMQDLYVDIGRSNALKQGSTYKNLSDDARDESFASDDTEPRNTNASSKVFLRTVSLTPNQELALKRQETPKIQHINVCSWNIWAIPFASPRTLSNPDRCAQYLIDKHQHFSGYLDDWHITGESATHISHEDISNATGWVQTDRDGVTILCLQELWAWRIGIFPQFVLYLASFLEYIPILGWFLSIIFQFLSFLFGLCTPCLKRYYNPKETFAARLRNILPYSVFVVDFMWNCMVDNGLLILSNIKPSEHGNQIYKVCKSEDYFSAKGFIWAHYKSHSLLVLNTHLQAAGEGDAERVEQLKQLNDFLDTWRTRVSHIVVCGDFNIDMSNHRPVVQVESSHAITSTSPQQNEAESLLDTITDPAKPAVGPVADNFQISSHEETSAEDEQRGTPWEQLSDFASDLSGTDGDTESELVHTPLTDPNATPKHHKELEAHMYTPTPKKRSRKHRQKRRKRVRRSSITALNAAMTQLSHNVVRHHATRGVDVGQHLGLRKMNSYEPTFLGSAENIDHILTNFEPFKKQTILFTNDSDLLSDHKLVLVEMQCY